MKPISKEQEQYLSRIKGICEAVEENLEKGKVPQEIARMFNAKQCYTFDYYYYEECLIDFEDFSITFSKPKNSNLWTWVNQDEILLFSTNNFIHWKEW